jgi:hypothetical protein
VWPLHRLGLVKALLDFEESARVVEKTYTLKPTLLFCRGKYMRGEPLIPT